MAPPCTIPRRLPEICWITRNVKANAGQKLCRWASSRWSPAICWCLTTTNVMSNCWPWTNSLHRPWVRLRVQGSEIQCECKPPQWLWTRKNRDNTICYPRCHCQCQWRSLRLVMSRRGGIMSIGPKEQDQCSDQSLSTCRLGHTNPSSQTHHHQ